MAVFESICFGERQKAPQVFGGGAVEFAFVWLDGAFVGMRVKVRCVSPKRVGRFDFGAPSLESRGTQVPVFVALPVHFIGLDVGVFFDLVSDWFSGCSENGCHVNGLGSQFFLRHLLSFWWTCNWLLGLGNDGGIAGSGVEAVVRFFVVEAELSAEMGNRNPKTVYVVGGNQKANGSRRV